MDSDSETPAPTKDKKKKKANRAKGKPDLVQNANGDLVTSKEFILEKTLAATTKSLHECQTRLVEIVKTNQELQVTLQQQEKDAIDVVSALQKVSDEKDARIVALEAKILQTIQDSELNSQRIISDCEQKLADYKSIMVEKETAYNVIQQEFTTIKDFRRKRQEMIQELDDQKLELIEAEQRHKEVINRLEKRFFDDKLRLQKEANRKIGELAAKAHNEAISNLKETTKEVYKENIRMTEALRYHVQDGEELKKLNEKLTTENKKLNESQELHNLIVKEKIEQSKLQADEISKLQSKNQIMEQSLSRVVVEFEKDREIIVQLAKEELQEVKNTVKKLKLNLSKKISEMKHVKRIAQHILNQRSDLERYFMEALEHVRNQARTSATDTKQQNLNGANQANSSKFEDLTWESKEKVLRILFAKMNGVSLTKSSERVRMVQEKIDQIKNQTTVNEVEV